MSSVKKTQYGDYATWVKFPVFSNYSVRVIVTEDLANSFGKRLGEHRLHGSTDAACFHDNNGRTWMFLRPDSDEGVVAHEAWHVLYGIHDYIGAKIENEIVAYHLGFLINAVHKFLKAVKSKRKGASNGRKRSSN